MKLTFLIGENSASIAMVPTGEVGRVALGRRVAAAGGHGQLDRDLAVLGQRADAVRRVEHVHAVDQRQVRRVDRTLALLVEADRVGLVSLDPEERLLQVEDDVGDVLDDARQRGELVQRALDRDVGDRRALERRQEHAAKRHAEGRAEATLERLAGKLSVGLAALLDLQRPGTNEIAPVLGHERGLLGGRFHGSPVDRQRRGRCLRPRYKITRSGWRRVAVGVGGRSR